LGFEHWKKRPNQSLHPIGMGGRCFPEINVTRAMPPGEFGCYLEGLLLPPINIQSVVTSNAPDKQELQARQPSKFIILDHVEPKSDRARSLSRRFITLTRRSIQSV
jgi:hypothetical protein